MIEKGNKLDEIYKGPDSFPKGRDNRLVMYVKHKIDLLAGTLYFQKKNLRQKVTASEKIAKNRQSGGHLLRPQPKCSFLAIKFIF